MKENLTPRQQELLEMLLKGIPPKEIAYNLDIAYNTFLFHQKELYRKLGVHSVHELFTKYAPANISAPESGEVAARKNALPLKWLVIFGVLLVAAVILFFVLKSTEPTDKAPVLDEGHPAVFSMWNTFIDKKGSSVNVTVARDDVIDDTPFTSYTMSGVLSSKERWPYAGMILHPVPLTLQAMKRMTSFSFKVLGDGRSYTVNIPTTDTQLSEEDTDHYKEMFSTINGQITTITINVDDLMQQGHGKQAPFIRDNIITMEFMAHWELLTESPEPFLLKVWDIRIY